MKIKNATSKGFIEINPGGVLNVAFPESETRRGRVIDDGNISPTLDTSCEIGTLTKDMRIRKLTPKECFRLQGFPDEYFERAASVCSDAQLYKQAGNSVTVNVIYEIAKRFNVKCANCKYYSRDYENNDVFCNNYNSELFRECVSLADTCNKWEPKE